MSNTYPYPNMEKILPTADVKDIPKMVLYADEDSKLSYDAEGENGIEKDDLLRFWKLGMVIISTEDGFFVPISCEVVTGTDGYTVVNVAANVTTTDVSGDTTALTLIPYYSTEYEAE